MAWFRRWAPFCMVAAVALYSDSVSADSPLDVIANAFNELGRVVAIPINAVTGWTLGEHEDSEKESMSGAQAGFAERAGRKTDATVSDIKEGAVQTGEAASNTASDAASSAESDAKDAASSAEWSGKNTKKHIEHGVDAAKEASSGDSEESTEDGAAKKTIADRASEAKDSFLETSEDVAKHPKEEIGNAMSSIGEGTSAASETVGHKTADKANSAAETVEDAATASTDKAAEKVGDASETVRDTAKGPSDSDKEHLWENERFFTN